MAKPGLGHKPTEQGEKSFSKRKYNILILIFTANFLFIFGCLLSEHFIVALILSIPLIYVFIELNKMKFAWVAQFLEALGKLIKSAFKKRDDSSSHSQY